MSSANVFCRPRFVMQCATFVNGLLISTAYAQQGTPAPEPPAQENPPEAEAPFSEQGQDSAPGPEAPAGETPAPSGVGETNDQTPEPEAPSADAPAPDAGMQGTEEAFSDADFQAFSDSNPLQQGEAEAIIVTTDRRSKDIQKVSSSVQSISGEDLERRGVTSVRELTAATPYVEVGASEGNIEVYMRGIGSNDNTEKGDPGSAPHIDGIYIPRPRGFGTMFYDVERVEVNLGPQGTVRGRNALGGSINIVTNAPKLGVWEANGSFQLGNYNQRLAKAAVNVPFGDRFSLRLATFSERRDPFYENRGGDPEIRAAEDADTWAYRVSGRWVPMDNVSVTVRLDNTKERGTGWVGSNYTDLLRLGLDPEEVPNPRAVAYVGHQPSQSLDHWGVSADIQIDFGAASLQVLSSYRDLQYRQNTGTTNGVFYHGIDAGDLDRYTTSVWYTTSESYVNEIRLFAPDTASFRWTAGFFHFAEEQYVFLGQVEDHTYGYMGQEFNHNDVPSGSIAGYVDATLDITDTLRALAGFRLTSEFKERHGIGGGFNFACNQTNVPEGETCAGFNDERYGTEGFQFTQDGRTRYDEGGRTASAEDARERVDIYLDGIETFGARDTLEELLNQPGADVGLGFREQHGDVSEVFPDFRVGGEWDVAPLNMLYLTFTTGHKSGGFNDTIYVEGEDRPYAATFESETLYATELGSKNVLLDRKLVLNAAAFWYAYLNYQTSNVQEFGPTEASTTVRENTGDARVLGLQADAVGYLPNGFTARGSMMLLDARYLGAQVLDTRVSWTPMAENTTDLEGNFLPRAPQLALSYGIEQNIPTAVGYFDWSLSGQTKSKMYMTQFNGEGHDLDGNYNPVFSDVVPWTTRLDASVGYTRTEGDIRIDAFVSNLTDMTYMTSLINVPNTNLRFFNPPRQFGGRLSMFL